MNIQTGEIFLKSGILDFKTFKLKYFEAENSLKDDTLMYEKNIDITAPTNVELSLIKKTSNSIEINSNAKDEDTDISGYTFMIFNSELNNWEKSYQTSNSRTYENLVYNNEYKFKVIATNEAQLNSEESSELVVKTDVDTIPPKNTQVSLKSKNSTSITVQAYAKDDETGISEYSFWCNSGDKWSDYSTDLSKIYSKLIPSKNYNFKVKDKSGNESESPIITIMTSNNSTTSNTNQNSTNVVQNKNAIRVTDISMYGFYNFNNNGWTDNVIMLYPGETRQLKAIILPENATNKKIIWTSSQKMYVTVNQNGLVTAGNVNTNGMISII